jgi:ABC-type thiamin/hydroxymethylpyrimidine transport system permease subunit
VSSTPTTSRFTTGQLTVIALVAVLVVIAKTVLRLPISVSGHGGVLWIAALIVGRAAVRRPGAATLMGFLGGMLVAIMQPSDAGMLLAVAKYVIPGIILDVLAPLFGDRFDRVPFAMLAGAAAHAGKVLVDVVQGYMAGLRGPLLVAGITSELLLHIAFGALGGLIAALLLRTLLRAGLPQFAGLTNEAEAS